MDRLDEWFNALCERMDWLLDDGTVWDWAFVCSGIVGIIGVSIGVMDLAFAIWQFVRTQHD